ncbi:hypothetical protein R1sor_000591 [Riccia sorocarpa]|uniref:SWIM-type domain-containing protein n=1 Tax=Riccia sorocarpa TaxID=122646 RepID=A0ABD3GXJ3_9MARC
MNCKKHLGKTLAQGLSKICYARTPESFEELLVALERCSDQGADMTDYLRQVDPWRWARCLFSLPRYGRTTSNIAESLNAALLPVREGAAFTIIVDLWHYVQQEFTQRRDKLRLLTGNLTPYAEGRFRHNARHSESLIYLRADNSQVAVRAHRGSTSFVIKRFDGIRGECTCSEYQEMLWPCRHGIAFERDLGKMAEDRVDRIWHVSSLWNIYDRNVVPTLDLTDLQPQLSCKAPPEAIRRGRHRTVRIPNGGASGPNGRGSGLHVNPEFSFPVGDSEALALMPNELTDLDDGF